MTRENKLALVVGFGLFLFVGILVSDHFSVASGQQIADLRPGSDPLIETRRRDAELIDVVNRRQMPEPTPAASVMHMLERGTDPRPLNDPAQAEVTSREPGRDRPSVSSAGSHREFSMPNLQSVASREVPVIGASTSSDPTTSNIAFHDVRPGETLSRICAAYYGEASLARQLARYNDLTNPNMLQAGRRLRIPPAHVLHGGTPSAVSAARTTPASTSTARTSPERTYVVQPGETLSEIAQRELGTAKKWRALYKHNARVIDDPDRLLAGTTLRIPD